MSTLQSASQKRKSGREIATATELLANAPLAEIDAILHALKTERPIAEVRAALVERIARAPLTEFPILKSLYLKHCAAAERP